jgi:hypothetical protein
VVLLRVNSRTSDFALTMWRIHFSRAKIDASVAELKGRTIEALIFSIDSQF